MSRRRTTGKSNGQKAAYIQELDRLVEDDHARHGSVKQEREKGRAERLTPLEMRLSRLLKSIPIEEQRAGLSLVDIQTRLVGRHRGKARSGDVGIAMRKFTYNGVRCWRRDGSDQGFRSLWHPTQ
jgi:hypothetical protein